MERHHEGHSEGRLRRSGRLREELLREHHHSPDIFCNFRADGAIRSRKRRRRRADETPRGKPQTGRESFQFQVERITRDCEKYRKILSKFYQTEDIFTFLQIIYSICNIIMVLHIIYIIYYSGQYIVFILQHYLPTLLIIFSIFSIKSIKTF